MKRISNKEALEVAYKNLYNSKLNKIDKNLKVLIKAKKHLTTHPQNNKK